MVCQRVLDGDGDPRRGSLAAMRALVVIGLVGCLAGADQASPFAPAPAPAQAAEPDAIDRGEAPKPGEASPAAPVPPTALRFAWDEYTTVVVVGDGIGLVRPCWIATWKKGEKPAADAFQVAYRAVAFKDDRGRIHVDARHAQVVGPISERWSPDSFVFGHRKLWTCDDRGDGHQADVGDAVTQAADADGYRKLLRQVQGLTEGGL